jgi:hypothetical protein
MGETNSNIVRAGTGSVEYPWSTLKLIVVVEPEADLETALGDEVADKVKADGDVADVHTETMSLKGSTFPIQIAVLLHKSRKR